MTARRAVLTTIPVVLLSLAACRTGGPWEARSPDRRTCLRVSPAAGRTCVAVDGQSDGCFDGVALPTVVFSAGHVAYSAQRDGRWTVVHDGLQSGRWEGVGRPELSPDGVRVAYPALAGGSWRVVVDGEAGPPFDSILDGTLRFGPDGARVVHAATRRGRTHVVLDGKPSRAWDGVARLTFDPAGDHVVYEARDEQGARVVVGDWTSPAYPALGELAVGGHRTPTAAWPPSVRTAYAARGPEGWRVVADGTEGPPFDAVRGLTVLDDGAAGYVARLAGREAVVHAGLPGRWHDRIESAAWAAGGRWAYAATDAGSAVVVLEGNVVARAAWAADVALGAGARHAYVVGHETGATVVDERGRHDYDFVVRGSLLYVDGAAWACLAGDRERADLDLVVDGTRRARVDWIALTRETERGGDARLVRDWVARRAQDLLGEPAP